MTIVDLISRSALVGFIMLRASYYYKKKGILCYVYSVYNIYSYGELSIYVSFILSQDRPYEVDVLLLYFDLQ